MVKGKNNYTFKSTNLTNNKNISKNKFNTDKYKPGYSDIIILDKNDIGDDMEDIEIKRKAYKDILDKTNIQSVRRKIKHNISLLEMKMDDLKREAGKNIKINDIKVDIVKNTSNNATKMLDNAINNRIMMRDAVNLPNSNIVNGINIKKPIADIPNTSDGENFTKGLLKSVTQVNVADIKKQKMYPIKKFNLEPGQIDRFSFTINKLLNYKENVAKGVIPKNKEMEKQAENICDYISPKFKETNWEIIKNCEALQFAKETLKGFNFDKIKNIEKKYINYDKIADSFKYSYSDPDKYIDEIKKNYASTPEESQIVGSALFAVGNFLFQQSIFISTTVSAVAFALPIGAKLISRLLISTFLSQVGAATGIHIGIDGVFSRFINFIVGVMAIYVNFNFLWNYGFSIGYNVYNFLNKTIGGIGKYTNKSLIDQFANSITYYSQLGINKIIGGGEVNFEHEDGDWRQTFNLAISFGIRLGLAWNIGKLFSNVVIPFLSSLL